ncbi:MAG: hypothetical protein ABSB49_13265 [Polyangia bacterium]
MKSSKDLSLLAIVAPVLGICALAGCPSTEGTEVSGSEVAISAVSGALNNTESKSPLGLNFVPREQGGAAERLWRQINPIAPAYAADWTCTGAVLTPAWSGPAADPYSYAPVSCTVTWGNGKTASAIWSSAFILNWSTPCDPATPFMDSQAANCSLTRTTGPGGNTRTLTGPSGETYAITHNTMGAGSGWDATVVPAPSDGGVVMTCGSTGCAASRTLVINGSHLTGTIDSLRAWDHTVSTSAAGISVVGAGADRVVTGTVYVQHNLVHATSATVFDNVVYGDTACCYPTGGSVTTTFLAGLDQGKSETLRFTLLCGEATLTRTNGATAALTLSQCL